MYRTAVISAAFFSIQAYKVALESQGHSEYALKAGFHLNPKAVEASLQVEYVLNAALSVLLAEEKLVILKSKPFIPGKHLMKRTAKFADKSLIKMWAWC